MQTSNHSWPAILLLLIIPCTLHAHPMAGDSIEQLTHQIEHFPDNPDLYIKRGEKLRISSQLMRALADFKQAAGLNPQHETVHLHLAYVFFELGQYQDAKANINHFLQQQPHHTKGLLLRALIARKNNNPLDAVQDYKRILSDKPNPDLFFELAQAFIEAEQPASAIQTLDTGLKQLGQLVALQTKAIELEIQLHHYDAALERIDAILKQTERQEKWLTWRGDIFMLAGRKQDAAGAYAAALEKLETLPDHLQRTPASQELLSYLKNNLN